LASFSSRAAIPVIFVSKSSLLISTRNEASAAQGSDWSDNLSTDHPDIKI
jgi:hypothetical protein